MTNTWSKGKVIYKNKWSRIIKNSYLHEDKKKDIFITDFGKRAAVILNRNEEILFVKQFRILIDDYSLEIPGGKVEDNESYEEGAVRECFEETNYQCESLDEVTFFHPGLETLHNPTKIFYTNKFKKRKDHSGSEIDEVVWVKEKKVLEMLDSNRFKDALTQIGLLSFFRKKIFIP